jgi:hypothetical protein
VVHGGNSKHLRASPNSVERNENEGKGDGMPWNFAAQLRGRPLRDIIDEGISIQFDCDACGHRAVWPWPVMLHEEKLRPYLGKMLHELAPKLRCVSCGQKNFYMRPYLASEAKKPTH